MTTTPAPDPRPTPKPPAPFKDWLDYMVLDGFARPISAKEDSGLLLYPVGWIEEQARAELASLRASAKEAAEAVAFIKFLPHHACFTGDCGHSHSGGCVAALKTTIYDQLAEMRVASATESPIYEAPKRADNPIMEEPA